MSEVKRMMEFIEPKNPGEKIRVNVNSSSIDLLLKCPRAAQYRVFMGLVSPDSEENEGRVFGKAIHKGMEVWYNEFPRTRESDQKAIAAFVESGQALSHLDAGEARSLDNGSKLLQDYFDTYREDTYSVLVGKNGRKAIEVDFELPLIELDNVSIYYFGTIDAVWKDSRTGRVFVVDHKTSRSLGHEFISRAKPNNQFTGYLWAAKKLGMDPAGFILHGLQVAKTKRTVLRVPTTRTDSEIEEWRLNVVTAVQTAMRYANFGFFPMSAPNACVEYGGCVYRDVCEAESKDRLKIIQAKYPAAWKNGVPNAAQ